MRVTLALVLGGVVGVLIAPIAGLVVVVIGLVAAAALPRAAPTQVRATALDHESPSRREPEVRKAVHGAHERPAVQRVEVEKHVERIVERQVVVMRCRFCKKLTPVDLTACESCGATP